MYVNVYSSCWKENLSEKVKEKVEKAEKDSVACKPGRERGEGSEK